MPEESPSSRTRAAVQLGRGVLLGLVGLLLAVTVTAPIALSSGDLVRWAASPTGLGLTGAWPWLVFVALDAAAGVCVLLSVYCAWRGRSSGAFGLLVWAFAAVSAAGNYRHGLLSGAADAWWFFPLMSVLGPLLLEAVTWLVRREVQRTSGERAGTRVKFGFVRWLPIVGAPRDTYGARRTAMILGLRTVDEAVATYHALCPDGSLKVVRAIRDRDVAAATKADRSAARGATSVAAAAPTNGHVVAATIRPTKPTNGDQRQATSHSDMAIQDATTIRARWPDGLPDRGAQRMVRTELGWHAKKATDALRAYRAPTDPT